MPRASILSFRLGGHDGVSVEAAKWQWALEEIGFDVTTVAGSGPVDFVVPGLDVDSVHEPSMGALAGALHRSELVVVENVCSLPMNPAAASNVARVLRGRRAVLRHHDLPWQRERFAHAPPPPDDPAWLHVTVNGRSQGELASRGIRATTIYNRVDTSLEPGDRAAARAELDIAADATVVVQPTRALARKNIGAAIDLCGALGATYWLTGPAEEGYEPEAERLLAQAVCPTRWDRGIDAVEDAYAAADLVILPSTWEGFGLPAIESAVHRRPLIIGDYPVAAELRAHGFRWFGLGDVDAIRAWLDERPPEPVEHNLGVVRRHFALASLPGDLRSLFDRAGWTW